MAEDVRGQIAQRASHFSAFSIACDESTDVSDSAQLLVFLRGVNEDFEVCQELAGLETLKGTTKGVDIFMAVERVMDKNDLKWETLSGITTDGAPAMVGNLAHFPSLREVGLMEEDTPKYLDILNNLEVEFDHRFEDFRGNTTAFELFAQPFSVNVDAVSEELQMELLELQSDSDLHSRFRELSLQDFYRSIPAHRYGKIRKHAQATTKLQRERVIELQYVDDCALVSHNPQDLQSVLTAAVRAYSRMGLTVNTIKTEVVCQWSANIPSTPPTFTAAGEQLSVVPFFRYLGSILSEDNTIDNEVQNRIKQASAAFGRLRRRVFQNKNLHLRTKVCVYQAICITTLLYSCEAWVTYSRHIRALEQFHICCLQRILGITWCDRVPHSEVLSKTNCRSIEATIIQHQLRWLGHVVRMPSNRLPCRVLYGQLHHGRRSAGGQKKRYKDQLKTALKKCKIRPEALEGVAADCNTWRQLCRDGSESGGESGGDWKFTETDF
ncbi:hypothetical protein NHX12_015075 [Muraenolepis orangiensis]|uniref:DUF4371 domain-containing protein n=1 Tax=Muraenolepis orangiensis TaxID=630683 RepID=A0A9Q0D9S0_9TELE|nr:hypothetical protein NHX12_015075 [Muraenolepis orangiensis]